MKCNQVLRGKKTQTSGLGREYRGINTPFLHNISNPPNGCVPRIYCSGSPLERRIQRLFNRLLRASGFFRLAFWDVLARGERCSCSQRSSFLAEGRSRVGCRTRGRKRWMARAYRRSEGGRRGIPWFLIPLYGALLVVMMWRGSKEFLNPKSRGSHVFNSIVID